MGHVSFFVFFVLFVCFMLLALVKSQVSSLCLQIQVEFNNFFQIHVLFSQIVIIVLSVLLWKHSNEQFELLNFLQLNKSK